MSVTQKPNGTPLYFYTNESRNKSHVDAAQASNPILSRKQRRKIDRKIKKIISTKEEL